MSLYISNLERETRLNMLILANAVQQKKPLYSLFNHLFIDCLYHFKLILYASRRLLFHFKRNGLYLL